jgi:hypothetical protein
LSLFASALTDAIKDTISKMEKSDFDEKAHTTMKQLLAGNVDEDLIPDSLFKYRIVHRASSASGFPRLDGPSKLSLIAYADAFPDRIKEAQKLNPNPK